MVGSCTAFGDYSRHALRCRKHSVLRPQSIPWQGTSLSHFIKHSNVFSDYFSIVASKIVYFFFCKLFADLFMIGEIAVAEAYRKRRLGRSYGKAGQEAYGDAFSSSSFWLDPLAFLVLHFSLLIDLLDVTDAEIIPPFIPSNFGLFLFGAKKIDLFGIDFKKFELHCYWLLEWNYFVLGFFLVRQISSCL